MSHENSARDLERDRTQRLRKYFDEVAWSPLESGRWTDTELEVSATRVNDYYTLREHTRNRMAMSRGGVYFLDAGCGARPYRMYAAGYRHHVCLDFSLSGLRGARKCLDGRGFFVLGDLRHIPFKSGAFDGFCSAYAVHHIPGAAGQQEALKELYRILKPGCSGAVIYDNPDHFAKKVKRLIRRAPRLRSFLLTFRQRRPAAHGGEQESHIGEALAERGTLLHYEPLPAHTILQSLTDENAIRVKTHSILTEQFKRDWFKDTLLWNSVARVCLLFESLTGGFLCPYAAVWNIFIAKKSAP